MKRKSWKRTAAFVTSLAMTTTMLPSDLSGFVTSIVHADEINLSAGSELPETIIAEPGEPWKVTVLPGTVKLGENGTNTETLVCPRVTKISSGKIYADEENYIEFRDSGSRDYKEGNAEGTNIYVASVDAEKKELTLTWKDPAATEGIHIDFEPVWNDITSIKQNGNEVHIPGIDQLFTNVKTGYEYVIRSKKALDIDPVKEVEGKKRIVDDVRFSASCEKAEENAADGAKYVYTFVAGREFVELKLRTINYKIKDVDISKKNEDGTYSPITDDNEKIGESLTDSNFKDITGTESNITNGKLSPDNRYKITTSSEKAWSDLAVFEDTNNDDIFNEGDQRVLAVRSYTPGAGTSGTYSYTFTAPYNKVFITRAEQEWNFAITKAGDEITATGEGIAENEAVVYRYGFNVKNFYQDAEHTNVADVTPYSLTETIIQAGDIDYEFSLGSVDTSNASESLAVWKSKESQVVISYRDSQGNVIDKPKSAGTYTVVGDVYFYDEEGSVSTDEIGDLHIEKQFKISPIGTLFTVTKSKYTEDETPKDYETTLGIENVNDGITKAAERDFDGAWLAPNVTVTVNATPLTEDTDYVIEGEVTSIEKGVHELVIVGIGDYEGVVATFNWYSDAAFASKIVYSGNPESEVGIDKEPYQFGSGFNWALKDFEGDQSNISYEIVSTLDQKVADDYLKADAAEKQKNKRNL